MGSPFGSYFRQPFRRAIGKRLLAPGISSALRKSLPFKCSLPGNIEFYASDLFRAHAIEYLTMSFGSYVPSVEEDTYFVISSPNYPIQRYSVSPSAWEALVAAWESSNNCTVLHITNALLSMEARDPLDVHSSGGTPVSVTTSVVTSQNGSRSGCADCLRIEHRVEELEKMIREGGRTRIRSNQTLTCQTCKTEGIMSWAERCPRCDTQIQAPAPTSCYTCSTPLVGKYCHNCGSKSASPSTDTSAASIPSTPLSAEQRQLIKNIANRSD
eukprot:TRINITY_DN204_c1_g4_i2.p1 TRINITY_DN204_c1_g4~~TRINITY_DN204_c1_g4_i2.p1  ORF type:complete len:270 (+),score=39.33 TRINITY_DN204_c1_g4_i2:330-1139(+)